MPGTCVGHSEAKTLFSIPSCETLSSNGPLSIYLKRQQYLDDWPDGK